MRHQSVALLSSGATLVDFGFGESAVTTEEWAAAAPGCRVVGIDQRAISPSPSGRGVGVRQQTLIDLVQGDVDACARFAPISVLRAMNVSRGMREDEVPGFRSALGNSLIDGGLLIDGSTDTEGAVLAAWLMRKRGGELVRESLLFHTDFSRGFSPWLFRDWLPRDLRRGVKRGTWIHDALTRWEARCSGGSARERFKSSIGEDVSANGWERANGFARLTP